MINELEEVVKRERSYYNALYERLEEFSSRREENQTMGELYKIFFDSLKLYESALFHFEKAVESYRQGDFKPLAEVASAPFPIPPTAGGGVLLATLASIRLPSSMFKAYLHGQIKLMVSRMAYMLSQHQENEAILEDFQNICSLMISFEFIDGEGGFEEDGDEGGWMAKALPFGLGIGAALLAPKIYKVGKEALAG